MKTQHRLSRYFGSTMIYSHTNRLKFLLDNNEKIDELIVNESLSKRVEYYLKNSNFGPYLLKLNLKGKVI